MCDLIHDASFFTDDLLRSFEFSRDYGKEAFANRYIMIVKNIEITS